MKQTMLHLWQRCRNPLMITLGFLPIPLLVTAHYVPEFLPFVWIWPLSYFLLDILGTFIRGKIRIVYTLSLFVIVLGITALMGIPPKSVWVCLLPILYLVLLLIEMPLSAEERSEQSHLTKYEIVGVVVHLIGQFLLAYARAAENPALEPVAPWFLISFFPFIILGFVILNDANLSFISRGRLSVSKAMKRKNLLLTLAVVVVSTAVALIPGVISALRTLIQWIPRIILWLLSLWEKLFLPLTEEPAENSDSEALESLPAPEENQLPPWLETVISVLIFVIVCAALLYAVYFLVKKLMILFRFLGKRLQKYMNAVSEDYVDVITDTRDDNGQASGRTKKSKNLSAADIRKLTPAQKIRYRYRHLMRKHPEWAKGSTARETLNFSAANMYERVRYGSYCAVDEDAQKFIEETKKV